MKSLVLYSSQSGNTKKLAQAVFDALTGEKEIYPVDQAPSFETGYDLVALGFWLQAGKPDPKSQALLSKCNKDMKLFLFATHGAAKGSDHAKAAMGHALNLVNGASVLGAFSCQGQVNPKVLEKVRKKETPPPWIKDADTAVGHPDESDLQGLVQMIQAL